MKKCETIYSVLDSYRDGTCLIQDSIYLDALNKINSQIPFSAFASHPSGIVYSLVGFGFIESMENAISLNYEQVVSLVEEVCSFESFRKTTTDLLSFLSLLEIISRNTRIFEISPTEQSHCMYGMKKYTTLLPSNIILTLCIFSSNAKKDGLFLFYLHSYFIFFGMPLTPKILNHFHNIKKLNLLRKFLKHSLSSPEREYAMKIQSLVTSCLNYENQLVLELLITEFDMLTPDTVSEIYGFCDAEEWRNGMDVLLASDLAISISFRHSIFPIEAIRLQQCMTSNPHLFFS